MLQAYFFPLVVMLPRAADRTNDHSQ